MTQEAPIQPKDGGIDLSPEQVSDLNGLLGDLRNGRSYRYGPTVADRIEGVIDSGDT